MHLQHIALLSAVSFFLIYIAAQWHKVAQEGVSKRLRSAETPTADFDAWCLQYGKTYNSNEEREYRLQIFLENLAQIVAHNNGPSGSKWQLGLNQFADQTREEFSDRVLGFRAPYLQNSRDDNSLPAEEQLAATEININWTKKNVVTEVKNQGTCGACWAFSTAGDLEGVNALNTGILISYSEQQLIDCSTPYGNFGCNGGQMDNAFEYVIDFGIETQASYPYYGFDTPCNYQSSLAKIVINSYTSFSIGKCDELIAALEKQPISVAVDAQSWQFYKGGIFGKQGCGSDLDHGVLLVGLEVDSTGSGYWYVKNSWGASWGDKGYIQLEFGNTCGICDSASTGNL